MDPAWPLFLLALFSIAMALLNQRLSSPLIAIVNRWARWILFASAFAWACGVYEWSERPYWLLAITFFTAWFVAETGYNWLAIAALSQSPVALFPRFTENTDGDEWPAFARAIALREQLRSRGFQQAQALKAEISPGIVLRSSVFEDAGHTLRIQIHFIPLNSGLFSICLSLQSRDAEGARYITDNLHLPFGGFYPEDWLVERRPLTRSFTRLLRRHQARLDALGATPAAWETEPLGDLNQQQSTLERLNTELGFLFPRDQHDEHGRITYEGRYRVWKETWLLNYLGLARMY